MRVLIVEDEVKMAGLIRRGLQEEGMAADVAKQGEDALWMAGSTDYDAVVLDVMLPGASGFEVLRTIRSQSQIPVLMLTARGEDVDRIVGLEVGADDYLPKPFNPRELVARIQNILKRSRQTRIREQFKIGDLRIDLGKKLVQINDQIVDITSTEFALLDLLIKNQEKVFSRDEIMRVLNGIDADIYSRAIDVLVSRLRHKLRRPELIRTVRGSGYQFVIR